MTLAGPMIDGGTVIVRNGRIESVGKDLPIPEGARVIEARKRFLAPGFVALDFKTDRRGDPIPGNGRALPRAEDEVPSEDPSFARAAAGGITTVAILPSPNTPVSGELAILGLVPGTPVRAVPVPGAPRGLALDLGPAGSMSEGARPRTGLGPASAEAEPLPAQSRPDLRRSAASGPGQAASRGGDRQSGEPAAAAGALPEILRAFEAARSQSQRRKSASRRGAKTSGDDPGAFPAPWLESLVSILRTGPAIHVRGAAPAEVQSLLDLARASGAARVVVRPADDATPASFAEMLSATAWVLPWTENPGRRQGDSDVGAQWIRRAGDGFAVCLAADPESLVPRPNLQAARAAVDAELTREATLALVSLCPARVLGLESRLGTIEPGKEADLVLFDRDPLSAYSRVELTIADGQVVYRAEDGRW